MDHAAWMKRLSEPGDKLDAIALRELFLEGMAATDPNTEEYALLKYLEEHYRRVSGAGEHSGDPF